jgi:phospho-N-acetylmuramoyl-pentapeptide-transferase
MLYYLFYVLHTKLSVFNVFRYITFRTVVAILSALIISFYLTPRAIKKFQEWKIKADRREDVPDTHETKKGTPTMGGAVILVATIIPTLLWADLRNEYIWMVTAALVMFGIIGYFDDIQKLKGLNGKEIGRASCRERVYVLV